METDFLKKCQEAMDKKISALETDLTRVRTGRASISLLDGIRVSYYGTPTPLNQVASLSTPDARTILVSPFDKKVLPLIEKAIQIADVGVQPNNDGNVIRLPIPPLNEERRKEIAKSMKKIGEDAKVAIRMLRQDFNTRIKKSEKDKEIGEDQSKQLQKEVQLLTDKFNVAVDTRVEKKEKEVLTV